MGASFEIPPTQRWMAADDEPERKRVVYEFRSWFQNPDKPLVERAVPRSVFEGHQALAGEDAAPMLVSAPKLLRKKIVRAKRRSGQQFTLRKGRNGRGEER